MRVVMRLVMVIVVNSVQLTPASDVERMREKRRRNAVVYVRETQGVVINSGCEIAKKVTKESRKVVRVSLCGKPRCRWREQ